MKQKNSCANNNNIFLIIPGCDDTNRGDQALVWETKRIAESAGCIGDFYILSDDEHSQQSLQKGILHAKCILSHPSSHFKNKDNIKYTRLLKLKWALVSILDVIRSEPLQYSLFRKIFVKCFPLETQKSLEKFERAKTVFVKGGGFLHAYGGLTDTYKIYYFLYHIRLAISCGANVYLMPNSFGPFNAPFVKLMIKHTLSKCKVVMAREKLSQVALKKECCVSSELFADLAFLFKGDPLFDAKAMLRQKGIPIGEKICVALTMRPYRFSGENDSTGKYQKYKQSLAEFIIWLADHNYCPVIVDHVSCNQSHENDMCCIEEVIQLLPANISYYVFSSNSLNAEQMKNIYGCFDYIVGTRFHSVIFSLASEVPAIAICYGGNKGIGIMSDLGLKEYAIPISEISSDMIISKFLDMIQNRASIENILHRELLKIHDQEDKIIALIRDN